MINATPSAQPHERSTLGLKSPLKSLIKRRNESTPIPETEPRAAFKLEVELELQFSDEGATGRYEEGNFGNGRNPGSGRDRDLHRFP